MATIKIEIRIKGKDRSIIRIARHISKVLPETTVHVRKSKNIIIKQKCSPSGFPRVLKYISGRTV